MARNKNDMFDQLIDFRIKDKDKALKHFRENMLNKTSQIFEYRGLPDSIPVAMLERGLQVGGVVLFHKVNDTLYFFNGSLGGPPDVYYRPTQFIVANPFLKYSKNVEIGVEGVIMRNDSANEGLLPLIYKYGTLLVESDISMYNAIIATRDYNVFVAKDDAAAESAREYQRRLEAGDTSVITDESMHEKGVARHPNPSAGGSLRELRESYQYIKSLLFNEIGLKTASNMKSQYVSDEENIINDDTLIPLVDNMLACRQEALKEINEMFGTNIEVKLQGTWELQKEEINAALDFVGAGGGEDHADVTNTVEEQESPEETPESEDGEGIESEFNDDAPEDESEDEVQVNIAIQVEDDSEEDESEEDDIEEDDEDEQKGA